MGPHRKEPPSPARFNCALEMLLYVLTAVHAFSDWCLNGPGHVSPKSTRSAVDGVSPCLLVSEGSYNVTSHRSRSQRERQRRTSGALASSLPESARSYRIAAGLTVNTRFVLPTGGPTSRQLEQGLLVCRSTQNVQL